MSRVLRVGEEVKRVRDAHTAGCNPPGRKDGGGLMCAVVVSATAVAA